MRLGFAAAGLVLLLALLRWWDPLPLERLRVAGFDVETRLLPPTPAAPNVIVVAIDEASLARFGQWPWPRSVMAALIDRLAEAGAKVVGLDILFSEPDRLGPGALLQSLPLLDPAVSEALDLLPDGDRLMAESLARVPTVLAIAAHGGPTGAGALASAVLVDDQAARYLTRYAGWVGNLSSIAAAASGQGLVGLAGDFDGRVRAVPALAVVGEATLATLALEMVRVAEGATVAIERSALGARRVVVGDRAAPTDRQGRFLVRFGAHDPSRFIGAADLVDGAVDPGRLADAWVLVGATASGMGDVRATGLGDLLYGVEIHAQVLDAVIAGTMLSRPAALPLIETALMATLAGVLVALGRRRRVVDIALAAVSMDVAVVLAAGAAARWAGLLTDPTFVAGSVLAVAALVIAQVVVATRARTEASLRALERELERAGRIAGVEQFASVVRHEIGQPLSSIAGFLEAARRVLERDGATATPKAIEHLGLATEQTRRVGDIVRGLQGMFARRPVEPRPETINALVEQAFAILALDDANRRPRRMLRLAPDLPLVPVDPVPMQQVLVNLGRNAVEALENRPGALITVTTRRAGDDMIAIDVADNGPGLDPAVADKLFAMSASSKGAGRGIGLAVSRVIVEDHGGTLTARANPTGGMTFTVLLPVAPEGA
jgi:CHASE2 domain-containing sensor protein